MPPPASIVVPTRARLAYLEVTLASIAEQARRAGAEIVVVDDAGASAAARELVERHGARYEPHERPRGLNAARNTGVERSTGELVAFLDDDVRAAEGWLEAVLGGAVAHADADVLAGRIVASLEGPAPRSCGREAFVTTLDLGAQDTQARFAWGANMTIRRSALDRAGAFDETLRDGGDEQEWQERLRAAEPQAKVVYLAAATVEHRRAGPDARLRALVRTAYTRGRAARRFDARRGAAPSRKGELATLAACAGHVIRRACPGGVVSVAHSLGRTVEAARSQGERTAAAADDFLSGASGTVGGIDTLRRAALDGAVDAGELISGRRARLALAARRSPPRRSVLVLGVERPERSETAAKLRAELERSRHEVRIATRPADGLGKFENLNLLLTEHDPSEHDWLLVADDDVELPGGFLDRFLFLCERFELLLAQPAHRLRSHAAWEVTRRRHRSLVRETSFVEIGPLTAFARPTFSTLLPFPALRMGWGLDVHWAALARERGWRCGVTDAVAIAHRLAPAADGYPREQAIAEARSFLAGRAYLPAAEAERTLTSHRRL